MRESVRLEGMHGAGVCGATAYTVTTYPHKAEDGAGAPAAPAVDAGTVSFLGLGPLLFFLASDAQSGEGQRLEPTLADGFAARFA